jgi:hypothetical protein
MLAPKKFLFISLFLTSSLLCAQTVRVTKSEQRVKGENAFGYSTSLESAKGEVNASLLKYMRTFGKPKQQDDLIVVPETTLNGQTYAKPLYAAVSGSGAAAKAWIGVSLKDWSTDSANVTTQLEGLVKTFGVNFYRDKIQAQIDEAQQAVEAVDKQQQRNLNEDKNLRQKIDNNKNEYEQLKKALENNRADSVNLFLRLDENMKSKDSLQLVSEKVKKALEFQKERQRKVN